MADFLLFETLDEHAFTALVTNGVAEGIALEFKAEPYGSKDDDKKEFLKDISALANTAGGLLLIGVRESDGIATAVEAIPTPIIDDLILRFEESYRTGIEPTLHGVKMRAVPVRNGAVLAIQVPKSAYPPHRVTFRGTNKYYLRHSKGIYEASYSELKNMFLQTADASDKAIDFHWSRIRKIEAGQSAIDVAGPKEQLIVHILPLGSANYPYAIDFKYTFQLDQQLRPMGDYMGYSPRMNVDGFAITTGGDQIYSYTQVFRNGSLEALQAGYIHPINGLPGIHARGIAKTLLESVPRLITAQRSLGVTPPLYVAVTLKGCLGASVICGDNTYSFHAPPILRTPDLSLPICVIEDYGTTEDYQSAIKPALDALWNAGGYTEWTRPTS